MGAGNGFDRDPPERFYKAEGGSTLASGGSVYQYETLGKAGLIIFLVMFVVIAALAVIAGYSLGVGEARAEDIDTRLRQMNARVSVLEYDSSQVYGELRARGLINGTHTTE